MVVDVETRAASLTVGKVAARACDACTRKLRASWYCPADDAFLCHSCDASIHSANQLAKRHVRVRLQAPSTSSLDKTTSVWYEGFKRKARTPRNKGSNEPLVPELGGGGEEDGFFSFSSTEEKEESMNCCVPVFDPFSLEMVIDDGVDITTNRGDLGEIEKAIMDDEGLIGFSSLDMDLGEFPLEMERLLEEDEQPFLEIKDDIGLEVDEDIGFETVLKRVKDEEEDGEAKCETGGSTTRESGGEESEGDQDRKKNLFLKLDYEDVITTWSRNDSPWLTGIKPEHNLGDYWRECLLGVGKYPSHVNDWFDEGTVPHGRGRFGGGSDGEREARVLRYKEKRRSRLFAKKIRYEVRKLNAEQRPRIKGRFVKRTSLFT